QQRHGERGQVVVADAQQVGAGQVVGGVEPERAAGGRLGGGRQVIERRVGRRSGVDQALHAHGQRVVLGQLRGERVDRRGPPQLVDGEPLAVGDEGTGGECDQAAGRLVQIRRGRAKQRLDRTAGER